MQTSIEQEREEQRRWRPRPGWTVEWAKQLLEQEFLAPDEQEARQWAALRRLLSFAADAVPYYRSLPRQAFTRLEDLTRLPILSRTILNVQGRALLARKLPSGQRWDRGTKSSGSTGQKVRISHTDHSHGMFARLKQRELRWYRFDPARLLVSTRPQRHIPRLPTGQRVADGEVCQLPAWPLVGPFFETGPFVGFAHSTPLERQFQWLDEYRPPYVLAQAATLEHFAFGHPDPGRCAYLRGFLSIAQQLTASMRRRVETTFGVPVHENYGLSEVGLVASRCPEAGRYHVHAEHCIVEIVDDAGQPCAAGERGRLLVTALQNYGMPLVRYDTGDLAEPAAGPCPCGRTLPSFAALHGRYRRIAFMPPGTFFYWTQLSCTLAELPRKLVAGLQQFQARQFRDGSFELRLVWPAGVPAEFRERVQAAWRDIVGAESIPLRIAQVAEIERGPGGKFDDFLSDFSPPPEAEAAA